MMDHMRVIGTPSKGNERVFNQDFDKLDVDFEEPGFEENDDIEKMLRDEAKQSDFDLIETDIRHLMTHDGSGNNSLQNSDSSLQKLVQNMPGILEDRPQANPELSGVNTLLQQSQSAPQIQMNMRSMNNQMNAMGNQINAQMNLKVLDQMSSLNNQINPMNNQMNQHLNNQMNQALISQISNQMNNQNSMDISMNSINSQMNTQNGQTDPLLGTIANKQGGPMMEQRQRIQNQSGPLVGSLNLAMSQNEMSTMDLEKEKMKLLSKLNEIQKRQQQNGNMSQPRSMGNLMTQQNNNMFMQQKNLMTAMNPNNNFSQQKPVTSNTSLSGVGRGMVPVGGVGGIGGGNSRETPLSAFLRAGRKSQHSVTAAKPNLNVTAQGALAQNVAGNIKTASIFSDLSTELDAISARTNMMASNPFLKTQNSQLLISMDKSTASQKLVNQLQDGATRNMGARGNPSFVNEAPLKSNHYRTTGIKHASETHLMRKAGLAKSKGKPTSLSRENQLFSLTKKKTNSRNNLSKEDSLSLLLPTKRRPSSASKHKLTSSRSQGNIILDGSNNSTTNAMW